MFVRATQDTYAPRTDALPLYGIAVAHLAAAVGVALHRRWGRVLGLLVAGVGAALGLLLVFAVTVVLVVFSGITLVGLGSVALSAVPLIGYGFVVIVLASHWGPALPEGRMGFGIRVLALPVVALLILGMLGAFGRTAPDPAEAPWCLANVATVAHWAASSNTSYEYACHVVYAVSHLGQ